MNLITLETINHEREQRLHRLFIAYHLFGSRYRINLILYTMQYPAIYNSAKEAFTAIENGTHKSIEIYRKEDYVRLNIDKLTHINGKEVIPIAAYTSGVNCEIEFSYKGETRINFAHIMYSNLTFKD